MKNLRCIILAAGAGTRMKTSMPKPLHRVGAKAMLVHLIDTVKSVGIGHITVVIGHGAEQVKDALSGYEITTVKQNKLLGSADAVKKASRHMKRFNGDILVLYSDTPLISKHTLRNLIRKHRRSSCACTLLTAEVDNPSGYGRIISDPFGKISQIVEEKDATSHQKNIKIVNVGAYCFKKKELFEKLASIKKNVKKGEFYLTDIIKRFKESALSIGSVNAASQEEALGINSREDLSLAEKAVRMKKVKQLMQQGVSFIDPDTAYIDDDVKIAKDTIIYPSVFIEGKVTIGKNCRVGPFTKIRGTTTIDSNTVIGNFVEVVRSKIGKNTRVKHHAYLGDAHIGNNVNVGAGAITANYDGKNKNRTVIKNKAFIGVGAVLIAPVKIGEAAVVGAGSVVTKNRNVPNRATVAGVPARLFKS